MFFFESENVAKLSGQQAPNAETTGTLRGSTVAHVGKNSTSVSFIGFKSRYDTVATAQMLRKAWIKATEAASVIKVTGVSTAATKAAPVEGLREVRELIADKWMVV